jgi:hypothetical protein
MVRYYADVHRTKKNREGCRITYSTDGISFKHVDSFGEFPAGPGDQVFVDTIPVQATRTALYIFCGGGLRSIILGGLR